MSAMERESIGHEGGDSFAPASTYRERAARAATDPAQSDNGAPSTSSEDHSLFSLQPIVRWLRYVRTSVKRRWPVAIAVFIVTTMLGGIALAGAPPLYQTSSTILLSGDRALGGFEGVTTTASRQANSVILRQASLDRMINELRLIEDEPEKPLFGRLADSLSSQLGGELTREQQVEAKRTQLRGSLLVFANDSEASINVQVLWPDPQQAAAIAGLAYDIFIEERTRVEVQPLEQSVEILSGRAAQASIIVTNLRDQLDLSPGDGAPSGSVLEGAVRSEQDLLSDLRVAEVELAEARAGVPLRYALLASPEVPTAPLSSNLFSYLATLIFAAVATGGICFLLSRPQGKIVAPWQLERFEVPLLALVPAEKR